MHTGDVVLEFDPSQQKYNSSRTAAICSRRNRKLRKQERTPVQTRRQDRLLKAKYAVRRRNSK